MIQPLLTVVTGRPASGKTTLSQILSKELKCPLLSRDQLKEGYVNSFQSHHKDLPATALQDIYTAFFQAIELFLANKISLVAEAAFQDKLWRPKLEPLIHLADIRIIICEIAPELARSRFTTRMAADPGREKFHGDSAELARQPDDSLIAAYKAPELPVPTLKVDTSADYDPGLDTILKFVLGNR
jgi:predicted kinase